VGDYGTGTVSVAESGSFYAQAVDLHASSDGVQSSTVRLAVGPQSAGTFVCDSLSIDTGAKLVVDTSAYEGDASWIKLIDCSVREGAFAKADITINGKGVVRQDKDQNVWLYRPKGR
jgi:hypothetical protein